VIPRKAFLDLIKDYSDDKEVFNMIQDDFVINNEELLGKFGVFCKACQSKTHSLHLCPLVHFIADREKIMKSHLYLNIDVRRKHPRSN
jgi:potassium voltage-gated channel Eag-related subfamily H protein 7